MENNQCGGQEQLKELAGYESIKIEKTKASCSLCEDYSLRQSSKQIAVISCEGACLRGDIAGRQQICYVTH